MVLGVVDSVCWVGCVVLSCLWWCQDSRDLDGKGFGMNIVCYDLIRHRIGWLIGRIDLVISQHDLRIEQGVSLFSSYTYLCLKELIYGCFLSSIRPSSR